MFTNKKIRGICLLLIVILLLNIWKRPIKKRGGTNLWDKIGTFNIYDDWIFSIIGLNKKNPSEVMLYNHFKTILFFVLIAVFMWGFLYLEPYIFGEKPNSNDHSPNSDGDHSPHSDGKGELPRGMSEIEELPRADSGHDFELSKPYRTTRFNEDLNKRPKSKHSILNFMENL